jgi:hypothetical protein
VSAGVEHPDIRYVVYPVHLDGTLTGELPRMRHDLDCGHFEFRGGVRLGTPVLANEEQMRTLKACNSCVNRRSGSLRVGSPDRVSAKVGQLCPTCHQAMPLTGLCDNCS